MYELILYVFLGAAILTAGYTLFMRIAHAQTYRQGIASPLCVRLESKRFLIVNDLVVCFALVYMSWRFKDLDFSVASLGGIGIIILFSVLGLLLITMVPVHLKGLLFLLYVSGETITYVSMFGFKKEFTFADIAYVCVKRRLGARRYSPSGSGGRTDRFITRVYGHNKKQLFFFENNMEDQDTFVKLLEEKEIPFV